ncbi:MAG: tRNA uridine-5-carboxymethylaminomethyl(34) synthesis GTPase MnmE [Gammaproteobacteria bacterium]|nr:tRNA uridine-5-carboxymethylaminomethyl(34) synthesis GTPase MnmE [Gammaproteobacteria bacterium]
MTDAPATNGDTIVARATPPGRGGIAVTRISGPGVRGMAANLLGRVPEPRMATFSGFFDRLGEAVDSGIALFFPAPHSFTGEDVLELQGHGGPIVCDLLIETVIGLGARLAQPGEFSRRAFLNDKLDLSQAEAIADLIDSDSRSAARAAQRSLQGQFSAAVLALNNKVTELRKYVEAAIDFPDEEIDFLNDDELAQRMAEVAAEFDRLEVAVRHGCLLRDGIHVVLAGRPNAGKSSLLNTLAGYEAAIVTDIPGTTRDLVREHIELDGLPVHIVDMAGLRDASGEVEQQGINRARQQISVADHALLIIDASQENPDDLDALLDQLPDELGYTIVRNKIDLTGETPGLISEAPLIVNVSALTGSGIDQLRRQIKKQFGFESASEGTITARQRHLTVLHKAHEHFERGQRQLLEHRAGELMAEELLQVQNALAEITGEFSSDDLLGEIFSSFCIGK